MNLWWTRIPNLQSVLLLSSIFGQPICALIALSQSVVEGQRPSHPLKALNTLEQHSLQMEVLRGVTDKLQSHLRVRFKNNLAKIKLSRKVLQAMQNCSKLSQKIGRPTTRSWKSRNPFAKMVPKQNPKTRWDGVPKSTVIHIYFDEFTKMGQQHSPMNSRSIVETTTLRALHMNQ